MAIRIVTDSASDLNTELENRYNIPVVPLTVIFDKEYLKDRAEITSEEFFNKLKTVETIPVTSQVTPKEFIDVFKPILEEKDEILGIFMSSQMSGTFNSALLAKKMLNTNKITIIDSKMVSLGEGLLVVKAAEMVSEGMQIEEIVVKLNVYIEKMKAFMILDTLEYLRKGGRLSASQAFIGGVLNLKPILTFSNGELVPLDRVRGRKKALNWIKNWLDVNNIDLSNKSVYMLHAQELQYLEDLKKILIEEYGAKHIIQSKVGAVVGTHSGPGAIAFCFIDD